MDLLRSFKQSQLFDISPLASSHDVAVKLRACNVGALLVTTPEKELLGVISERDLTQAFADDGMRFSCRSAEALMTSNVVSCSAQDDVFETMKRLNEKNIRHIPVLEEGRAIAMLSIRDFEHACAEFKRQAVTDGLTGLANRRAFEEKLKNEFELHRRFRAPLSIALFDIDHFKLVNDAYGHTVGDQVLMEFARMLNRSSPRSDHVARFGGEEFSMLFPDTCVREASTISEEVLAKTASSEFQTSAGNLSITLSGGVSTFHQTDGSGSEILERADALLYQAKDAGRNQLFFDDANGVAVHSLG